MTSTEAGLFAGTVINHDKTITCTNHETGCYFTFRNPNNLDFNANALDPRKNYPFPLIYHNIPTCNCPLQVKQFWHTEYRDNVITLLKRQYRDLDLFASIDGVNEFWYGKTITETIKQEAWDRINVWENTMRMLAALKACMEMYTAPRDTTLNANAYLHGGQILWTIEGLLPDGEENADHESIDRLEQRDRGGVEELIPAEEAIKGNIQVGE